MFVRWRRENGGPSAVARSQTNQAAPEPEKGEDRKEQVGAYAQHNNSDQKAQPWQAPARADRKKNPVIATETSLADGKELYQQECLICHGPAGKGDGPKADTLMVRPDDLTRPKMWEPTDG